MRIDICTCRLSETCVNEIDRLRLRIMSLLRKHFGFDDEKSASLAMPESAVANRDTHDAFCHVVITGMSAIEKRPYDKLVVARRELEMLFEEVLRRHTQSESEVSLYVAFSMDRPVNNGSNLVESEETLVIKLE